MCCAHVVSRCCAVHCFCVMFTSNCFKTNLCEICDAVKSPAWTRTTAGADFYTFQYCRASKKSSSDTWISIWSTSRRLIASYNGTRYRCFARIRLPAKFVSHWYVHLYNCVFLLHDSIIFSNAVFCLFLNSHGVNCVYISNTPGAQHQLRRWWRREEHQRGLQGSGTNFNFTKLNNNSDGARIGQTHVSLWSSRSGQVVRKLSLCIFLLTL